jgi:GABA(A) receptor-associated protein
MMSYKNSKSLEQRIEESNKIISRHPNYIPVIIESSDPEIIKSLKKRKFLCPKEVSSSYLMCSIRNNLKLESSKALFLFYNNVLVSGQQIMGDLYEHYKIKNNITVNDDLFFYVTLTCENTFG